MKLAPIQTISLLALLCAPLLGGCRISVGSGETTHIDYEEDYEDREHSETDLPARMRAASKISSLITRDKVYFSIAVDAAECGNFDATQKALSSISSILKRDDAAERSALLFLQQDQPDAARLLAGRISSIITRDRVLARIAG